MDIDFAFPMVKIFLGCLRNNDRVLLGRVTF